ncbi:MAG: hypothetical protein A4E51_01391 [Methanosaeta sp. PtaU1.Bin055]|nr:MAG: hypothetical protein A4E51_01391 [Methanosaeta sp. PtaU1.Bin055]
MGLGACAAGLLLAPRDGGDHRDGLLIVGRRDDGDAEVDSYRRESAPDGVRVDLPGVEIPPLQDQDRPLIGPGEVLQLGEDIPLRADEGVDEVFGGLPLDPDPVADDVVSHLQDPQGHPHPHRLQHPGEAPLPRVDDDEGGGLLLGEAGWTEGAEGPGLSGLALRPWPHLADDELPSAPRAGRDARDLSSPCSAGGRASSTPRSPRLPSTPPVRPAHLPDLLAHALLFPVADPAIRLVPRPPGDEDDDPAGPRSARPPLPLDRPDLAGDRLVE